MNAIARTFKPDPLPLPDAPAGNSFVRYITAHAKAALTRRAPLDVARELWPHDLFTLALLQRATSSPAMTSVVGWAQEVAPRIVHDFTEALYGQSAAAAVFAESLRLTWNGAAQIVVPGFAVNIGTDTAGFVAEGAPIPLFQPSAGAVTLLPHKAAGIFTLTREIIESSNAEAMVNDVAARAIGRVLDEVLVDANPGDASRPPGLRNGIAALTPSAPGDPWTAFVQDVGKLADAVGPVASNSPICFIGSPGRALKARMLMGREHENVSVFGSSAIINDFVCVATAALVVAFDPTPEIETSKLADLQEQNTPSSGLMTGSPVRSLWQTDTIGFKTRLPVSWALRNAAGFAWMTPTGW